MFHTIEQEDRIRAEQAIMRAEKASDANLCQYKNVSCVRCCLPHIGGDSHTEGSGIYLGPGNLPMRFTNFNPLLDPKIVASQYEDSFPDVGRREMERRFSERRELFLAIYDHAQPRQSLLRYMRAAKINEGYKYAHEANSGPVSLYLGGSIPKTFQRGELPECQLLGFIDGEKRPGCMAHPLAETSHGYDGRDQVGFFHHTGCCEAVGCEASMEFRFLSMSAMKVFDRAVEGMSWYEYSRHATSVLVYYLRGYDHIFQRLDERGLLDSLTLEHLVQFTNTLYDEWPLRKLERDLNSGRMGALDILTTNIPLAERIMYIALDTWFQPQHAARQIDQARAHVEKTLHRV